VTSTVGHRVERRLIEMAEALRAVEVGDVPPVVVPLADSRAPIPAYPELSVARECAQQRELPEIADVTSVSVLHRAQPT
jgi:hypothetical protein